MRYVLAMMVAAGSLVCARGVDGQARHDHAHHDAAQSHAVQGEQVERVRQATARFRDIDVARREGYRLFGAEGALMGEHWYHPDLVRLPLDLERPSTLQYATIDGRKVLVGVAYTWYRRPDEPLPEGFAGTDDRWHTHDVTRLARAATAERPLLRSIVERRIRRGRVGAGEGRTMLTMVHAWIWYAVAETAWTAYLADRARILRPGQAARMRRVMDAATEPGHVH